MEPERRGFQLEDLQVQSLGALALGRREWGWRIGANAGVSALGGRGLAGWGLEVCRGSGAPQAVVEEGPYNRWLRGGFSILATRGGRGQGAPSLCRSAGSWARGGAESRARAPERGPRAGPVPAPRPQRTPGPPRPEGDAGRVSQVASGRGEAAAQRYGAEREGGDRDRDGLRADPAACPGAGRRDPGLDGGRG